MRAGSWLFAMLAIWAALLRLPLYGACTLLLAAGLARPISGAVAKLPCGTAAMRCALVGLARRCWSSWRRLSSGRQAIREHLARGRIAASALGARNVVLIVWDTVRASSLSLHGYPRNTTPNWRAGQKGRPYQLAPSRRPRGRTPRIAASSPASGLSSSIPSGSITLDAPDPTLAEYLASRGYQTAGFAANTTTATHESGLDRGFAHYEDFPLTPRSLLGRTVPGRWILTNILYRGDFYAEKWIGLQSRGAPRINEAFLGWLRRRRHDRPFFAFLNYFDAHDPYVPPAGFVGRFGIRPKTPRDYRLLFDYAQEPVRARPERDVCDGPRLL